MYDDFKLKEPFGLHGAYKKISALYRIKLLNWITRLDAGWKIMNRQTNLHPWYGSQTRNSSICNLDMLPYILAHNNELADGWPTNMASQMVGLQHWACRWLANNHGFIDGCHKYWPTIIGSQMVGLQQLGPQMVGQHLWAHRWLS